MEFPLITATTYPKGSIFMFGSGVSTSTFYEVLGVTTASTLDEIKKSYRLLARTHHPDSHPHATLEQKADHTAKFRAATEAWEWMEKNHVQIEALSEPGETIVSVVSSTVDGYPVQIVVKDVTEQYYYDRMITRRKTFVVMSLATVYALHDITSITFDDNLSIDGIDVIDGSELLFKVETYYDNKVYRLDDEIQKYERKLKLASYQASLDGFVNTQNRLAQIGRPVNRLQTETVNLRAMLASYSHGWLQGLDPKVMSQIKACENEINRIKDGGTQLIVDGLIDGSIWHEDMAQVQETIDAIKVASIRSNGYIDPFNETLLRQHIEKRIGTNDGVNELRLTSLRLDVSDYAPSDMLDDLQADGLLAPAALEIQTRKGMISYDVTYSVIEIDGAETRVGMITIPLSVYEKNAPEYGKPSEFPELPYGIQLYLRVTNDNTPVAEGLAFDKDGSISKKVTKYKRARNKSGQNTGSSLFAFDDRLFSSTVYNDPNRQRYNARIKW